MRPFSPLRSPLAAALLLLIAPAGSGAAPRARTATPFEVQVRLLAVSGTTARPVPLGHPFASAERVRFEVRPGRSCYVRVVHTGPNGMRLRLWPEEGVLPLAAGERTLVPAGGVLRFDRAGDQPVELVFSLVAAPRPGRPVRQVRLQPAAPAPGGVYRFAGTLDGQQAATVALTLRRR